MVPRATEDRRLVTFHSTTVDVEGNGVLIQGASGTGKSALALQMMALGARLVADDRTDLTCVDGRLKAQCPVAIRDKIEARGIGILRASALSETWVSLVVDLDRAATERLPLHQTVTFLGVTLPCLYNVDAAYFPAAVLQYVRQRSFDVDD